MKRISPLIIAVALGSSALLGFSVAPVLANNNNKKSSANTTPIECSYPNAAANHPDWFAVGGQCELTYPQTNKQNNDSVFGNP